MKKNYTIPVFAAEQFEVNEAVSACYVGTAYCAKPGTSESYINDGVSSNGHGHNSKCDNDTTIFIDSAGTASGYLTFSSGATTTASRIIIGGLAESGASSACSDVTTAVDNSYSVGSYYYIRWTTASEAEGKALGHYGLLEITGTNGNHS